MRMIMDEIITQEFFEIPCHNLSGIMRNFELNKEVKIGDVVYSKDIVREISPHWPGIGKYVGSVQDFFYSPDRHHWQKRRVYQDELDYSNNLRDNFGKFKY